MKDKKRIAIIVLSVISVIFLITGGYLWIALRNSEAYNVEIQELMALEKEEMLNDLTSAQIQYDELMVRINNDSLKFKLEREQMRTQQLLEELKSTRATSAAEIKRLKKELNTLREVLADYTRQIDELYRENTELKNENSKLIAGKKKIEREKSNLEKDKKALEEKVDLAAQLDATNVEMKMLRSNGKTTENIKRAKQICVSCTISKNITASTGDKTAYVRIMQPNGEPLTKGYSNTFRYQNRDMNYSMCKDLEFTGEEQDLVFYWDIEETLQKGRYNVYIFVDGNMIGEGFADFD